MILRQVTKAYKVLPKSWFAKKKGEKDAEETEEKETVDEDSEKSLQTRLRRKQERINISASVEQKSIQLYQKYAENLNKILTTGEGKELWLGMIVRRYPIFMSYNENTLPQQKQEFAYRYKHGYISSIPKDLTELEEESELESFKKLRDVDPTHQYELNGRKTFYRMHSKYYLHVDPDRPFDGGVQSAPCENVYLLVKREGKWQFPMAPVLNKNSFQEIKDSLLKGIFATDAKVMHQSAEPLIVGHEQARSSLYFQATHIHGLLKAEVEHAWVPKQWMSKYLQKHYFDQVIKGISFEPCVFG